MNKNPLAATSTPAIAVPLAPAGTRRATAAEVARSHHRLAWFLIACTLTGMILGAADQTIVSAAMPRIFSDLSGFSQYAWVTTAYLLGATLTMPLYGKLADLFEAKWIFLFGLVLFVTASALCGLSQSITHLIVLRALQGVGAGALAPVGVVIMSTFITPERRSGIQGTTGGILLVATVAGPVLGGWLSDQGPLLGHLITESTRWRWVFFINVPIGLTIAALLAVFMPRLRLRHGDARLDTVGVGLLATSAAPILIISSIPASQRPFLGADATWPAVGLSILLFALFIVHEMRHEEPLVDPRLFKTRIFAVSAATISMLSATTFAGLVYIPLYAQGVFSHSSTTAGLALAPLMLASISGRLIISPLRKHRNWTRPITMSCLILVFAGAAVLFEMEPTSPSATIVVAMVILGAGLGASNMLLFAAGLSPIARTRYGQATGTLLFLRSLVGAVMIGLLGTFLSSRYAARMAVDLPRFCAGTHQFAFCSNPRAVLLLRHAAQEGLHHPLLRIMRLTLANSLHDVFTVVVGMAALAFALPAIFPFRMTRQAQEEAALVAESGVAAVGELVPLDDHDDDGPSPQQIRRAWDVMCHVLYWRHGAVSFATSGPPAVHSFNQFEELVALPSSLHERALAAAFERVWPLVRERTALDRYRAESIASLLLEVSAVEGDIATCGGTGDGAALLLALLARELHLPKRVYYFEAAAGSAADEAGGMGATGTTERARPLAELRAALGLDTVLIHESGGLKQRLAALGPARRFSLIHIDSTLYPLVRLCLNRLLPLAPAGAAVVIGQYHNSRDGARRAARERARRTDVPFFADPLPQVHFFTARRPRGPHPGAGGAPAPHAVDWTALRSNQAYNRFLSWIAGETAACYDGADASQRDRHIAAALDRMELAERADMFLERFAAEIDGSAS